MQAETLNKVKSQGTIVTTANTRIQAYYNGFAKSIAKQRLDKHSATE
jgi:hypothetical protein